MELQIFAIDIKSDRIGGEPVAGDGDIKLLRGCGEYVERIGDIPAFLFRAAEHLDERMTHLCVVSKTDTGDDG